MVDIGRALLDQAYASLGGCGGRLLDVDADLAAFVGHGGGRAEWTDLGEWLGLASRLGAEKVLFVRDEPVIVFKDQSAAHDPTEIAALYRRTWCMSEPRSLFVAVPGELQIYLLDQPPALDVFPAAPWRTLTNADEVLALTRDVEDRGLDLLGPARQDGAAPARADQRLIDDLRHVRGQLETTGLTMPQAHALIGRSILIRYLEDRGVLNEAYFRKVAEGDPAWQRALNDPGPTPIFGPSRRTRYYNRVLRDPGFAHALFAQLASDFNGDLFELGGARSERFGEAPLQLLRSFLLGEAQAGQPPLFFWAYDFEVVPLSLISSIYEQFYHDARKKDAKEHPDLENASDHVILDDEESVTPTSHDEELSEHDGTDVELKTSTGDGTHYTPASLVHDVLRRTLTMESLESRPRVLDLACGSGIFLVEAFRRIVRFEAYAAGRKLKPTELRAILQDRIVGIDVNEEAARVAAFSLYLALLDQQEPPEILAGPSLPHLIHTGTRDEDHYGAILPTNAFLVTAAERTSFAQRVASNKRYAGRVHDFNALKPNSSLDLAGEGFDVIVGNPPWEEAADKGSLPRTWVLASRLPVGEWSYSQLFMLRALALLKPGGVAGLLVNAKVLWNQRPTSQEFRRQFLARATVRQVVNMVHVRRVFFSKAVAPFVFISYVNSPPKPGTRLVIWNARRTGVVQRLGSLSLVPLERRVVDQAELMNADYLWKTYWWGGHRDAALVARLRTERTLAELIAGIEPAPAYGWQTGDKPASAVVARLQQLRSQPLETSGHLQKSWFVAPPKKTGRDPEPRIYEGQRIIVTRGVKGGFGPYARLEHTAFSFRHAVLCIPLPNFPEPQAKIVLGIMWSKLGRYSQFMRSGAWGGWFDQVTKEDVLSTPMRLALPQGMPPQEHAHATDRIVAAIDGLRDVDDPKGGLTAKLLADLDDAVFDLFEFSGPERDLVRDFWAEEFDLLQNGPRAGAVMAPALPRVPQGTAADVAGDHRQGDLHRYLAAFLETWNPQMSHDAEFIWQVARSPGGNSLAVAFVPVRCGAELPPPAEGEWAKLAGRCVGALGRPISPAFSMDWVVRGISRAGFVFVKANARRLWTASAAREDAEAAFLRLASEIPAQVH